MNITKINGPVPKNDKQKYIVQYKFHHFHSKQDRMTFVWAKYLPCILIGFSLLCSYELLDSHPFSERGKLFQHPFKEYYLPCISNFNP